MDPVILTGMHRSGTSAIARLVQALGVNIGSDLLGAAGGNIHGHFEEAAFIRFHDKLIDRMFPNRAPFCEWLPLADTNAGYMEADRKEAKSIWKAHRDTGGSGWKDPRASLFLDFWTELLPDAKVIVCVRHPYQVHRSLLRRGEPALHVDYSAAIQGASIYGLRLLRSLSVLPKDRIVVVDADSAFREPSRLAEELARFLGLPTEEKALAAICPEDFHFEDEDGAGFDRFEEFFPEAMALYRQLRQFDLLHPVPYFPTMPRSDLPIQSEEARLIEFEEVCGLRAQSKKMLVRSIAVDRKRTENHYRQLVRVEAEKDRLIEDLSRLTDGLKGRLAELEGPGEKASH